MLWRTLHKPALPWIAFSPLAFLLATGCSPRAGTVRGTVALGGANLQAGTVMLCYPNGAILAAAIDSDGNYELRNAPVGEVKVCVVNLYGTENTPKQLAEERPPPPAPKSFPIPKRYEKMENGLPYTVRSGVQTFHIRLEP
jgi:hypothetical protein